MIPVIDNESVLLITPEVEQAVHAYFGWGRFDYPPNKVEQGGWLVGYYPACEPGCVQGVATHFLPAIHCKGTPSYLDWPTSENLRLQNEFFALKREMNKTDPERASKLKLLGWIHSHPNTLPVFLSGTDMENIYTNFHEFRYFSAVINPHTQRFRAFVGTEAREVPMVFLSSFLNPTGTVPNQTVRRKKGKKSTYGYPRGGKHKKRKKRKHNKKG